MASDAKLVELTLAGDREAFGQLVERYQSPIYGLVCHYAGKYGEAEDLAQETFLEAYRNLKQLKEHDKLSAWLKGIAYRVCMNWLRREEKRLQKTVSHEAATAEEISYEAIITAGVPADEELTRSDIRGAVLDAVASLPEKYQLPVTLRYLQELSYAEIATFMELPKSTVRGILYRANKLLREELREVWVKGEVEWRHVIE